MKIFLAGATGALGRRLLPLLLGSGYQVVGMTNTPEKADALRAAGAEPVVVNGLERDAVRRAVMQARPRVVVQQMTSLARMRNLRNFDHEFALTNRLRTEGTAHLLAAARDAGADCFVAQSFTGWPNERIGGRVKSECDPLDRDPPPAMRQTLEAIRQLESMVSGAADLTGIVLRYGSFYGPGTSLGHGGEIIAAVQKRMFPIFGDGAGVWSFIHIDNAAQATALAIERADRGTYNIVDDEPAEVSLWLPDLSAALGAKPPYRLPAWLGRIALGEAGLSLMTKIRGSSNAVARRDLGWRPGFASWREGFRRGLGDGD